MRILIVDDDASILACLKSSLQAAGYFVEATTNAEQAAKMVGSSSYQLFILDINLRQKINGTELCRKARLCNKNCAILMLTVLNDLNTKKICFRSGADDYLTKPFELEELKARVQALLRRSPQPVREDILHYANLKLDLTKGEVWRGKREVKLTPREHHLLDFMLRHSDALLSRDQLLKAAWTYSEDPNPNTLEVHMHCLREKIDGKNTKKLIHTIYGFGYMLGAKD